MPLSISIVIIHFYYHCLLIFNLQCVFKLLLVNLSDKFHYFYHSHFKTSDHASRINPDHIRRDDVEVLYPETTKNFDRLPILYRVSKKKTLSTLSIIVSRWLKYGRSEKQVSHTGGGGGGGGGARHMYI